MRARTRVLLTIGRLETGGAELRLLHLLREINRRRLAVEVTVLVVSGLAGELDGEFRSCGARIVYGRHSIRGLLALWRHCRRTRPDVLHVNADSAAGLFGLAGWAAGVPVRIAHFRSTREDCGFRRRVRLSALEILTSLSCNLHLGVCDAARDGRWLFGRWRTIYSGVQVPADGADDPDRHDAACGRARWPREGDDVVRMLMLGRIASGKNLPRAVSILAACRAKGLKARLHVVGPVDERFRDGWTDLCRRIQADGLPVVVEGATAHPLRHMRRSSLMLLTSNREGLPGAVLESLACGTPVVASALPGVMEIAARVRGIVPVDGCADDQQWVDAIDVALRMSREDIKASFAVGPFQLGRYVDDMLEAWGDGATT